MRYLPPVLLACACTVVSTTSTANPPETDISILTDNDLYGNLSSTRYAALALGTLHTQKQAIISCQSLGEGLWRGQRKELLDLVNQENHVPDTRYWIGGDSDTCTTITSEGKVKDEDCQKRLPVLCSQSAPFSFPSTEDTSTRWQTTVTTQNQAYTGYRDKLTFRFLGIPYAPQPERFTHSTPSTITGSFSALQFGPECIQPGCASPTCSEDCLFLNVWTPFLPLASSNSTNTSSYHRPPRAARVLKPVFFWIHGGAFTSGTGSDPTFDGGNMASRGDIVFISTNYRLSTFGFLALADGQTNGNYGIGDLITALQWVHTHIADFGGDPERITIGGQSAGAGAVRALLSSEKAKGLFHAAIMMSNLGGANYGTTYSEYLTIAQEVQIAAEPTLADTNCTNAASQVDCLRALDPYTLNTLAQYNSLARYIVQDNDIITTPRLPLNSASTPSTHIPILAGTTRDDAAAFLPFPSPGTTLSTFLAAQNATWADLAASTTLFPTPSSSNSSLDIFNTTARIGTLAGLRCTTYATAHAATVHNSLGAVFVYEFNRTYQPRTYSPNAPVCEAPRSPIHPDGNPEEEYFKCHSGELLFVFGTLLRNGYGDRDGADVEFSRGVLDVWTGFVRTGRPDGETLGVQGWQSIGDGGEKMVIFQRESEVVAWTEGEQCDALGYGVNFYG